MILYTTIMLLEFTSIFGWVNSSVLSLFHDNNCHCSFVCVLAGIQVAVHKPS